MNIPLGLGRQLAEEVSVFARQYEQVHASSSAMPIRASPLKNNTWEHPAQRRPIMRSVECDSGSLTEDDKLVGHDLGGENLDDSQALFID